LNNIKSLEDIDCSYKDYDLYNCLTVCSNQLVDTTNVLKLSSGWVPFSIRKGESPRVWLSAPVEFDSNNNPIKFLDLIVNSEIKHEAVSFVNSVHGFQVIINNIVVIEAGNHNGIDLEIVKIDLSPIGLPQVIGDIKGLKIGGMTMSRSGVKNSNTFIGL